MTLDLGITRRQRYVSDKTAANVTSSTYAQGGTITSYTYSGTTYIAHIFTSSGIFTVTSDIYPLDFIAVAGGGGGGNSLGSQAGGGGGGGGIVASGLLTTINKVYPSSAYIAVTTSTQANVLGGWVADSVFSDFNGSGAFHFTWRAIQQTAGGARTAVIPEQGADHQQAPLQFYMEIGITGIGPVDVAVALIRDGYPKDGFANMPYLNLNGGAAVGWTGVVTALGTFVAGDTLQIAWDASNAAGVGTYWWAGKNNTWAAGPFNYSNYALTTSTYQANGLRMIFMSAAAGGGSVRGQFRAGNENIYPAPSNGNALGISATTITNYSGYYTTPLGSNYVSSGTTYGVIIGAGGGVNSSSPTAQQGAPGSNGGDTVIYNPINPSFYYSTYFSNSYITATNAAFAFGTGDFTIETWLYPTASYGKYNAAYNIHPIFNSRTFINPDAADRGFIVYLDWYNKVTIQTSGTTYINTVNTVTNGVWSHLAVSRTNNIFNVWINGVKDRNTFFTATNFTNNSIMIGYGSNNNDLTQPTFFTGYLSNYRMVKGLSVYNPGIQGLTAPLTSTQLANVKGTPSTAIAGTLTSLLMLTTSTGAGAFYDSSLGTTATLTNNNVVTASGLGPGTYSGSLSFNGTNQYLTSATSTAFTFGTSDFTVEYWVYYNATNVTFQHAVGNATGSFGYAFGINTNLLHMTTVGIGYATTVIIKIQQWLHIAWARSGTNINVYMNGSWVYTFNNMVDNITETGFAIGARPTPTFYTNGYLSNIRVVKGVALYTNQGNFTPPTTISSATQSTSTNFTINAITTQTVLLTFNTATIVDLSTLSNVLTQTSGTVSISTFAPFTTSTVSLRAFGGGGGGAPTYGNGQIGGSGGGAPGLGHGGAAIPGQGNRGGQGSQSLGSGGGGFAYPGGPAVNEGTWPIYTANGQTPAGYGGAGGYFNHSGAMVAYSGGGGGGSWSITAYGVGLGGVGGGGNGGYYNITSNALIAATAGTRNLGGGGGGSNVSVSNAAAGGSGIVIFRYPAFLGDAARSPTDLTDTNLKNTTLLLSSNRTPTALTPVYSTTSSSNSFVVDYLIVGGGGGGGGSTSTVTGGSGGGAGGVVAAVGYIPPGSFNTMFYADTAYTNGLATYPTTVGGWVNAGTDFISSSASGYNWQYDNRGNSAPAAKTTALSEQTSYYIEIYCGATVLGPYSNQTGNRGLQIGLLRNSQTITTGWTGIDLFDGNIIANDVTQSSPLGGWVTGDILNIAFDPINNKQWFGKNGVWWNGITPGTSGSGWNISGTGYLTIGFSNQSSNSSSMQGVFRKSTANTYTTPTGFIPYTSGIILTSSTWTITVGSGGAGGTSGAIPTSGSSGANSSISFSNTNFIAYGGGGGGALILSTSTIGSLYFNGTSNYLKITNSVSFFSVFGNVGTGSKTIEFWTYYIASGAGDVAYTYDKYNIFGNWVASSVNGRFALGINNFDKFSFTYTTGPAAASVVYTSASVPKGTWTHIAFVCVGTSAITIYINGVGETLTVDLSTHVGASAVVNDSSVWYNIGGQNQTGAGGTYTGYYNGYITNFRIVNGVAVYTGNFNVPAGPLTLTQSANPFGGSNTQAIPSGTQLLLSVNSATSYITDSSTNNFSIGNATGVTYYYYAPLTLLSNYQGGSGASGGGGSYNVGGFVTVSGQGNVGAPTSSMLLASGASLSFNGSSQYLSVPDNIVYQFGTGNFTVELWFYPTSIPAGFPALIGRWDSSLGRSWVLQFNATSLIWTTGAALVSGGDNTLTASSLSIAAATWYHVAVTRTGTAQYIYLNGVQVGTNSSSVNMTGTSPLSIGVYGIPTSPLSYFPGYISNVRVVKGLAVYTGAFTVPTRVLTITQTANPYGGSNVQAISTASYTSLLLTSSSITDLSSYNSTVTNNGSVVTTSSYPPINLFTYPGGGGGGAGSAGSWNANAVTGGSGGVGTYTSILSTATALSAGVGQVVGSLVYFAGGGSGAGTSSGSSSLGGGALLGNGTRYTGGGGAAGWTTNTGTGVFSYSFSSGQGSSGGARSTALNDSGSYYFEIVYTSGTFPLFGLARDTSVGGYTSNVPSIFAFDGTGYGGMTGGTTLGQYVAGDIIRIAYNASTNKVWIGRNAVWYLDPASTGGTTIPGTGNLRFIIMSGTPSGTQMAGTFRYYTSNTYSPPAGFTVINAPVAYAIYNSEGWVSASTDYNPVGSTTSAGAGGSGVVVIRYPNIQPDATITPSSAATYINTGGYKTYIFTATSTITFANSSTYSTVNYITGYTSGTPIINNRTISDSSYNNIVINTATTTLAQGTFSPYGSMWSTSFNGSTDYLAFASTGTIFAQNSFFGANKSFTIEAWLNPNGFQTSNTATVILGDALPIGSGLAWSVGLDAQLKPMMYWRDIINGNNFITATNSISTGTWNHVAWVSNAGTPTIYINGLNQIVTTSTISTLTNTTQTFGMVVGPYFNKFYNGSISNLKASTSVLYLPDSRGNGASAYFNGTNYLSIAGSLSSTLVSATWGPATIEAWVWPTSTVNQHIFSSAQQVYLGANLVPFNLSTFNGQPNDGGYYIGFGSYNGTAWNSLLTTTTPLNINTWQHIAAVVSGEATKTISLYLNGVLIGSKSIASSGGWNGGGNTNNISYIGARWDSPAYFTGYISNVRFSNTATIYTGNFTPPALDLTNVSGTQLLSLLTTNTTVKDNSANSYVVTQVGGTRNNPLVGGFAPFTSTTYTSFTPSLIPFNAPVNTVLLTCNTYRHIDISTSSIAINTGTITSTPRIQRYSPYSMGYAYNPLTISGSASFNGFSDFVYTTTATDITNFTGTATSLQFESDFTVECWIYTTSTAVVQTIFDTAGKEGNTLRPNAFSLNMSTSGQLYFNYNNATSASSNLPVYRFAWTHIAVTRYSGIMQIWQNGSLTLGVNTTTNYSTGQMLIGRNGPTATAYFSGFISDFRVINGQAIYTNTFNPPVASLKPIDSTTSTGLLLNFNNVAIADATMNHNVIVVNSATISSSVTKYNPRSIFFPGVSEYLTVVPNSTSSYALGTADFTVEMWAYILPQAGWVGVNNLQPTTNRALFDMRTQNTANAGFDIYLTNTGTINVSTLNTVYVVGTTFVSVNNWHHIALVKKSTSFNLYLNGIPEGLNTATYITNFINPTVRIGFGVQTGYFNGYIDDVRITRGVARYSYPGFLVPQKSLPVK